MSATRHGSALACFTAALALLTVHAPAAQTRGGLATIAPGSLQTLRSWSTQTDAMLRSGDLRVRQTRDDTLMPGRIAERSDQYYKGVRVFGGDVSRQIDDQGVVRSIFGNVYSGIDIAPDPGLSQDEARARVVALAGMDQGPSNQPELVVLPLTSGDQPALASAATGAPSYRLAWRMRAVTPHADIIQYFLDASSGAVLLQYSDRQSQAAVGKATGVLGDIKKISASGTAPNFIAKDLLRPAVVQTDDLKGDPNRTNNFLDGLTNLGQSDIATDADNVWTDGPTSDAHIYAGYTYDYYFKRFGLKGLNNNNIRMLVLGNPVRQQDFSQFFTQFPDFFVNAFYAGNGIVLYGVGLPPGFTLAGQSWNYTSASLDIVAHELSHGVTEFSSNLIYLNESGALNEAFSDVMGTSVKFFFRPVGNGIQMANYGLGADSVSGGGLRSLADPSLHGDPDNYSKRFTGTADGGGIHTNVCIADNAFYLAIESGTNKTSGLSVQGVGAANRDQIEKVFFRGFTQLLPANATFAMARAATIQAARDLYGVGSAPERAITQAWTAVGVN